MLRYLIVNLLILLSFGKQTQKKSAVLNVQSISLPDKGNYKKIVYTLKNLDKTKAIMINLQQFADLKLSQFQLNITTASATAHCSFKYTNNLCVLEHSSTEVNVTLECLAETCKFNLVFSQRSVAFVNDDMDYKRKMTVPGDIFKIGKRNFNTILEIYAQREQHKVLSEQITVFSNVHAFPLQQIEQLDTNTAVFGLKPIKRDHDHYVYINSKSLKSDHFTASFRSHNGQISDSISIVDFMEHFGNHSKNIYAFKGKITNNLQVNLRIFSPRNSTGIPLNLKIRGKNQKGVNQTELAQVKINQINFQKNKFFDLTYAFNQTSLIKEFLDIQLQLGEVEDKSIFFQLQVKDAQVFEINIFDHIYFSAKAGQLLHFTVTPQVKFKLADGEKDIQLLTNSNQKYFSNIQSCSLQKGCDIEIKSQAACSSCSFKFNIKDQDVMNHIIYYDVSDEAITGKVDMQEQLYFKYAMNGKESVQVVVNSINVLIYAIFDTYQRCKIPRASCHQFAISQQNQLIITNKDSQPVQLILVIVGLEKTSFKVRFIKQTNGLIVNMGQKFSYLMSNEQKQVQLKLQLPQNFNEQVHFNLVSPIHSSRLIVMNGQKGENRVFSLNGYVSFRNKDILSDIFSIKIEKINKYYDEYLHFTLFVTSNTTSIRLDQSNAHYQKYAPHEQKIFLIEYDPSEVNAINIYTEDLQKNKNNMSLIIKKVKSSQDETPSKPLLSNYLVKDYQFIVLEIFEECSDINCELQVSITSNSDVQLQQTLNIIKSESIISLDDSIWAVFQINELTKSNHFYFIPRHEGKTIKILFNTDDTNLYVNFRIFNKKHSINPQDWPFEHKVTQKVGHIPAHQEINIDGNDTELQECWPDCVIIININDASKESQARLPSQQFIKSYKIIATNTIIQLMENTKIEFTLRSLQERDFFIMMDQKFDVLTFYTYYSVGRAKISAAIVHNSKQYPLKQASFNDFQTRIQRRYAYPEIVRNQIKLQQALLKVNIKAETDLKMTLEYTSAIKGIRQIKPDQLTIFKLNLHEHLIYQFTPDKDFTLKLYRHQGFPIFKIFKCTEKDYINCLDHNKKLFQSQTQQFLAIQSKVKANLEKQIVLNDHKKTDIEIFVEKSFILSGEACTQCIYFIWVYCFQGQLQLTLNLRSTNTQIQLKQMQSFLQKVQPGQKNRYLINMVQGKRSIIGVTPIQGSIQVIINKGKTVLYNQTLISGQQYKQYQIESQNEDVIQDSEQKLFKTVRGFNQGNFFKHVHIKVASISQKTAQFSIIYNIGQSSSVYLQDGIVLKRGLSAGTQINFFYRNKNQQEHAYLTISAERNDFTQAVANLLSIQFYYYPDAGNRSVKELFVPELPPKRNENYLGNTFTAVYELPVKYELYEVNIFGNAYATVTASINHQQLVYLPLGFDYLIKLHPRQTLNIVIDTPFQQFLELKVQKCGQSSPRLQYTNDAHQFKQGVFQAESIITNNNFKQYIKTKQNSNTMHFKFIANADADALFTVSAVGRNNKYINQENRYEPGGEGAVNYRIVQDQVEVTFKPVLCQNKQCVEIINYFLVIAESMTKVHEELNCAGAYFVPQAPLITTDIIEINKANLDTKRNQYVYRIKMKKKQAFIGVKGVVSDSKEEIQYIPIQIHDIWGQISEVPFSIIVYVALILALILTIVIVVSTKLARRGYKPIASED